MLEPLEPVEVIKTYCRKCWTLIVVVRANGPAPGLCQRCADAYDLESSEEDDA